MPERTAKDTSVSMKHFINQEMAAANVMTFAVDPAIVGEFEGLSQAQLDQTGFARARPSWKSDIQWVSASSTSQFEVFQSAFDRLGIAAHATPFLDLDREVRLYAGFLVLRSRCSEPNFHLDWIKTNNEAFTLMTPVSGNTASFGLLYKSLSGDVREYDYRSGEAIAFGDHFVHSTKPGQSSEPVVLLCFSYGTDKMEHWDKIRATAGYQSRLVRRPDGKFVQGMGEFSS